MSNLIIKRSKVESSMFSSDFNAWRWLNGYILQNEQTHAYNESLIKNRNWSFEFSVYQTYWLLWLYFCD